MSTLNRKPCFCWSISCAKTRRLKPDHFPNEEMEKSSASQMKRASRQVKSLNKINFFRNYKTHYLLLSSGRSGLWENSSNRKWSNGLVPEVRIRNGPLDAESYRARSWYEAGTGPKQSRKLVGVLILVSHSSRCIKLASWRFGLLFSTGCVLCSPGCFSMFRGSALMDDNVMNTYTTKSTEAKHYVQYDQGKSVSPNKGLHAKISVTPRTLRFFLEFRFFFTEEIAHRFCSSLEWTEKQVLCEQAKTDGCVPCCFSKATVSSTQRLLTRSRLRLKVSTNSTTKWG